MGFYKKQRDKAAQYAENTDIRNQITSKGQTDFVNTVMKEEGVDRETALRWCLGIDPSHPEISMGYKLSDPIWMTGCFYQPGRKARAQARENFKKSLTPEEAVLFDQYCEGRNAGKLRKQMKDEAKRMKKTHRDVDVSEFEGEDDDE